MPRESPNRPAPPSRLFGVVHGCLTAFNALPLSLYVEPTTFFNILDKRYFYEAFLDLL